MLVGLLAVLALLLLPLTKVVYTLARRAMAGSSSSRERYYRMGGEEKPPSLADRLEVEYFEGGGFSVGGLVVAPGCHIILTIMAMVFILGGSLLTFLCQQEEVVGPQEGGLLEREAAGPLVVAIGLLMLLLGVLLWHLARSARGTKLATLQVRVCPAISQAPPGAQTTSFSSISPGPRAPDTAAPSVKGVGAGPPQGLSVSR